MARSMLLLGLLSSSVLAAVPRDILSKRTICHPGQTTVNGQLYTITCGVDRPGTNYKETKTDSWDACISACTSDSQCATAQYHENTGFCYLKDNIPSEETVPGVDSVVRGSGCTNGGPQTLNNLQCNILCGVDYAGGDYRSDWIGSVQGCAEACSVDDNCVTAQYNEGNGYCYFKNELTGASDNAGTDSIICDRGNDTPDEPTTTSAVDASSTSSVAAVPTTTSTTAAAPTTTSTTAAAPTTTSAAGPSTYPVTTISTKSTTSSAAGTGTSSVKTSSAAGPSSYVVSSSVKTSSTSTKCTTSTSSKAATTSTTAKAVTTSTSAGYGYNQPTTTSAKAPTTTSTKAPTTSAKAPTTLSTSTKCTTTTTSKSAYPTGSTGGLKTGSSCTKGTECASGLCTSTKLCGPVPFAWPCRQNSDCAGGRCGILGLCGI